MASNECFTLFTATEDIQILHYYGVEVVTTAKKVLIAALVQKTGKVEVEEFLKQTFSSKKQIILAPYFGGSSFSLDDIPFEQLEEICAFKPSCEPSSIVGAHNADEYNSLHSAFVNSPSDDRAAALEAVRNFAHKSVLENLAASIHKEFASYYNPIDNQHFCFWGTEKCIQQTNIKFKGPKLARRKMKPLKRDLKLGQLCHLLLLGQPKLLNLKSLKAKGQGRR